MSITARNANSGVTVALVFGIIFGTVVFIFFIVFLIVFIRICKQVRRMKMTSTAPVVVTSTTHTAPSGYTTQVPGYQTNVYMTSAQPPYPTQTGGVQQMPMPMPGMQPPPPGVQPYMAPYPQMPMPTANNMNPPSYDVVVAGNSSGQPNTAVYEKQAPYNPSYPSH